MRTIFWRASLGFSILLALACKNGATEPVCGNGIVEAGEACEDGNTTNGDGCSSVCQAEAGAEICNNNADDDGDGLVDCADSNCATNAACQAGGALIGEACAADGQCADGACLDEPVDGFPQGYCSEGCTLAAGTCSQAQDALCTDVGFGDGTGLCLDLCNPAGNDCRNGYDCFDLQNGTGVCFPACTADAQCPTTNNCSIEIGFCTLPELCSGGVDEDFDGSIDCADPDCQGNAACQGSPEVCNNNIDDDLDNATDCADADCANNAACQGAGDLQTIDLGAVPTGQSRTFTVPAGALGFTILVQGDVGNFYDVARLVKPDGTVLINNGNSATILQFASEQAFGLVMPANNIAANSVTAGQWQFTIESQLADSPNVKVLIRGGPFAGGLQDLKIYLPTGLIACQNANCNNGNGTAINAANAASFLEIQGALNTYFGEFYADEGGFSQGNVQFFNINNNAFLDISSQTELDNLYRQSVIGGAGGMHFFLVQTFSGEFAGGVAGIASGIPGAITSANNRNSGVAVQISGDTNQNGNITGLTMAHEGGHFMGLFHTTEFDGSPDLVSDTPSCAAATIGGANLQNCPDASFMMFPSLLDSMQNISNGQVITLRAGPLAR